MKVLIVSFRFAPFNSIGTNRINELSNYFEKQNIDYKIITSYAGLHESNSFVHNSKVTYVSWFNFSTFKMVKKNVSNNLVEKGNSETKNKNKSFLSFFKKKLKSILSVFLYPDPYLHWVFSSFKKGKKIINEFGPDIIYSSSYPFSSHVLAYLLSKNCDIQWFAELRDPWIDDHTNLKPSKIKTNIDSIFSKFIFKKVSALVTVSEVWRTNLQDIYNKKTYVIRNGFVLNHVEEDLSFNDVLIKIKESKKKKIIYTGSIHSKNQNMMCFLEVFTKKPEFEKEYEFIYIGGQNDLIKEFLKKLNYKGDNVTLIGKVPLKLAIEIQKLADFLLIFNWKSNRKIEKGIIPGKFYEYLGTNLPVLLWNEGIENELYSLCNQINESSERNKIIIYDGRSSLLDRLKGINYNPSMEYVSKFKRENQFNNLINIFRDAIQK